MDAYLNVLLVVTGSLQVGALAACIAGRKRSALAMAGINAALALAKKVLRRPIETTPVNRTLQL